MAIVGDKQPFRLVMQIDGSMKPVNEWDGDLMSGMGISRQLPTVAKYAQRRKQHVKPQHHKDEARETV